MTDIYQKRRHRIAGIMILSNVVFLTIYRSYQHLIPDINLKTYFPIIIILLVGTVCLYQIYKFSSRDQRIAVLALPGTLLILFLISLLA